VQLCGITVLSIAVVRLCDVTVLCMKLCNVTVLCVMVARYNGALRCDYAVLLCALVVGVSVISSVLNNPTSILFFGCG